MPRQRYNTTIRLGAAHNEVRSVDRERGEEVTIPLEDASPAQVHALALTLSQMHGFGAKPPPLPAKKAKRKRPDIAKALAHAVNAAVSSDTTVRLIKKQPAPETPNVPA